MESDNFIKPYSLSAVLFREVKDGGCVFISSLMYKHSDVNKLFIDYLEKM
jgi:hypothetical protein